MGFISAGSEQTPNSDQNTRWFNQEVTPHEPALRAHLLRQYPTLSEVDDVVQESFLRTFLAHQKGKLTCVRGYLFAVARNTAVSVFRKRKFISPVSVNDLFESSVLQDDANVVEAACTEDELALISEAIAHLPGRCRQIAVLRLTKGLEYPEIAQRLGISEGTVRVQVARGVKKCTKFLRDRGVIGEKS